MILSMFNQEQLAAIAAAVSILQQSMQSNPTSNNSAQNGSSSGGLNSMGTLEAALPMNSEHHMQRLPGPQVTTTPITTSSQHSPLMNQLRLQYNRSADLDVLQNSTPYPPPLQLDEHQQQLLLSHLRVIQQPTAQQQDSQHHLNNILPDFAQQRHHQEQHNLLQSKLRELQQLSNLHLSAPISPNRPQTVMAPLDQHQHQQPFQLQLKPEPDRQQHATHNNQLSSNAAKPSRPISYSAIVAKSAGLSANNNSNSNNTNIDIFNTNNLTGSSLGHTNGSSSLLSQRNSNNLLSLEPSLDGYNPDYPISPAQQFFNQQNSSFRHDQVSNPTLSNQQQLSNNHSNFNTDIVFNTNSRDKGTPPYGTATNLLGFMGLYVGNLSPELSKEQLEKIFSKYGEPVKAHRLVRSPVAFIKYDNTESPRAAIDDLYGVLIPELTLNPDQPLKLHFDRNDTQLKANYRPTELPNEDNGECYGWRTTVCKRGKSCPKKHIPINRGIDFQMWMIKSNP